MLMGRNPAMQNDETQKIFVDADAFVSIFHSTDRNHNQALLISNHLKTKNILLITSNLAIGEAITVISQDVGLAEAVAFGNKVFSGDTQIIYVDKNQELKALDNFAKATSKNVRFTDFVNMVLMDELRIDTIFSFDKHYPQSGYKLLSIPS